MMKNKFLLSWLVVIAFQFFITGCVTRGEVSKPLTPIGTSQSEKNELAIINFYRSTDAFGLLSPVTTYGVVATDPEGFTEKHDQDYSRIWIADRSLYSSIGIKPGTYNFRFRGMSAQVSHDFSSQIAKVEGGKSYYLAVSFSVGGVAGLEFRDKQDFDNATKDRERVVKVKSFNFIDGFDYEKQ